MKTVLIETGNYVLPLVLVQAVTALPDSFALFNMPTGDDFNKVVSTKMDLHRSLGKVNYGVVLTNGLDLKRPGVQDYFNLVIKIDTDLNTSMNTVTVEKNSLGQIGHQGVFSHDDIDKVIIDMILFKGLRG